MTISFGTVTPALSEEHASSENITSHHSSDQIINSLLYCLNQCLQDVIFMLQRGRMGCEPTAA